MLVVRTRVKSYGERIIAVLPSTFKNFRVAIDTRNELTTPENLRTKIVEEYEARNAVSNSSQGAMYAKKKFVKKKWCNESHNKNESNKEDRTPEKSRGIKCYKCHERGHKALECKNKKSVIQDECQAANNAVKELWCIDSGCTSHICGDLSAFTKIDNVESSKLKLASEATANILHKGMVEFVTNLNGKKCNMNLSDTLHVPEVRTNSFP
ncbi:uncharacterized protein LOC122503120 [Leptopilina heterotoma]|uniref:uncharacterized protein LOC122503120 n=1 Tax=Leptopilina heterotoma TaxID=63436 RepID=UPI001CA99A97|nr:uncharacterized protein LOC122503120 [Leptopilina heterotoma]